MEIIERVSATEQKRISKLVQAALRAGTLARPTACAWCGATHQRIHGHHPDYARPLMVVWICASCHRRHHARDEGEQRMFKSLREPPALPLRDKISAATFLARFRRKGGADPTEALRVYCLRRAGLSSKAIAADWGLSRNQVNERERRGGTIQDHARVAGLWS